MEGYINTDIKIKVFHRKKLKNTLCTEMININFQWLGAKPGSVNFPWRKKIWQEKVNLLLSEYEHYSSVLSHVTV